MDVDIMDPRSAEIVASAMAGASICWAFAYAWAKWLARPEASPGPAASPAASADRLLRLEQAIDAVAIEVERIGEGQRHTARLLAERLPAGLPLDRVQAE